MRPNPAQISAGANRVSPAGGTSDVRFPGLAAGLLTLLGALRLLIAASATFYLLGEARTPSTMLGIAVALAVGILGVVQATSAWRLRRSSVRFLAVMATVATATLGLVAILARLLDEPVDWTAVAITAAFLVGDVGILASLRRGPAT